MTPNSIPTESVPPDSGNPLEERVNTLRSLFPEAFTEGKPDVAKLATLFGDDTLGDTSERYSFSWSGKRDAIRRLQTPSRATLVPVPDESVNFDVTQNIYIEGENLEVLKLLRKSYFGQVKMIYIDPPYNTGNDFIYPDNFADPLEHYLRATGQKDERGNLMTSNPESSGRYHSNWLSMMYPRLWIARQLLREDGVIFVSIDDHEVHDLRMLMNEVFGEENFVATIAVINNMKGRNDKANVATCHESLIIYTRSNYVSFGIPLSENQLKLYQFRDSNGESFALRDLRKRGRPDRREDRPKMYFPIFFNKKAGTCSLVKQSDDDIAIYPKRGDGSDGRWRWGLETVKKNIRYLHPRYSQAKERWDIDHRVYLNLGVIADESNEEVDDDEQIYLRTSKSKSFWWGGDISTDVANREFKKLLGEINPDYPKSPFFIERILHMGAGNKDMVMDFFSGYATTAHAVLNLNREDGGNRRFILVQIPEPCDETSDAFKAGYQTIADIGKERIRRVIKRMAEGEQTKIETRETPEDLGFRVFKLEESTRSDWNDYEGDDRETYIRQLEMQLDPLKRRADQLGIEDDHEKREEWEQAVIWETALREGYGLGSMILTLPVVGKNSFFKVKDLDKNQEFTICLDEEIAIVNVQALKLKKEETFICRSIALTDETAVNLNSQVRLKVI